MNMNNLKIGTRLAIGFGTLLLLTFGVVAVLYLRLVMTQVDTQSAVDYARRAGLADSWVHKSQLNVNRVVSIAKSAGQPAISEHFSPLIKQTTAEISELQKELEAAVTDDAAKTAMARVGEKRKSYIAARGEMYELLKAADQPAVDALLKTRLLPASAVYLATMEEYKQLEEAGAAARAQQTLSTLRTTQFLLAGLLAASLLVGILLAIVITRSVTRPLHEAVGFARVIAASDLSQRIDSSRKDELGDLLRALSAMQVSLSGIVGQVRIATESINTASSEIATGNLDLSVRTEQTASNLQQAASSMEQLTGTVRQSADSARQANQLASSAAEVAARGGIVVSQVVTTMDEINQSSKKISDIIGVIDGIAFQTNILALNAAVEAARAGEQGRGFAVVASEVRSLAQRSAQAAKEIKALIGASVDRVEAGSRLVADAGKTMQEIVGSVQRVTDIIGEITAATSEQSDGIGLVCTSVNQLDHMTQKNSALVEESAAAAESLREQAARLASAVSVFRVDSRVDSRTAQPA